MEGITCVRSIMASRHVACHACCLITPLHVARLAWRQSGLHGDACMMRLLGAVCVGEVCAQVALLGMCEFA